MNTIPSLYPTVTTFNQRVASDQEFRETYQPFFFKLCEDIQKEVEKHLKTEPRPDNELAIGLDCSMDDLFKVEFFEEINLFRRRHGMTVQDLAFQNGIDVASITYLIINQMMPQLASLRHAGKASDSTIANIRQMFNKPDQN